MGESVSREREPDLRKKGVDIALRLFERMYIPPEYEEFFESEERMITMANLRNMLEAAREAERIGSYDWFKLKAVYIARNASSEDQLYRYVRNLLRELERSEQDEERKIKLAMHALEASIYIFTGLRKGFRRVFYGRR